MGAVPKGPTQACNLPAGPSCPTWHTHKVFSPSWAWAGPGMGGNAPDIWEALATLSHACLFGEMHLLPHMEPGGGGTDGLVT